MRPLFSMCQHILPLQPPEVSALQLIVSFPRPDSLQAPPCKLTFFPCLDMSLPLQSPEVSTLHLVAFFPCPNKQVPLSVGPSRQCPLQCCVLSDSTSARLPSGRGASAPCKALLCSGLSHLPPPLLLRHTPWAPTPRVLQRWLYQPRQQTQCWQGSQPWQVQRA